MYTIRYLFTKTTRRYIYLDKILILVPEMSRRLAPFEYIYEKGHIIGLLAENIDNEMYKKVKDWPEKIECALIKLWIKELPIPDICAVDRDKEYLILYEKAK